MGELALTPCAFRDATQKLPCTFNLDVEGLGYLDGGGEADVSRRSRVSGGNRGDAGGRGSETSSRAGRRVSLSRGTKRDQGGIRGAQ